MNKYVYGFGAKLWRITAVFAACLYCSSASAVTVYAAASLTDALKQVNTAYESAYDSKPVSSFAASSVLAKQIENGAKADVFISADMDWMQHLVRKNIITKTQYTPLLGNRLVLIAPKNKPILSKIVMQQGFDISQSFNGKFCTGHTASVPVGKYSKQALTNLGFWSKIAPNLVEADNTRTALNFVNRGECALGSVYMTDAHSAKNVDIVGVFPINSHAPIVYPVAYLNHDKDTMRYYQFLQSKTAATIFKQHGFSVLQ